MKLNLKLLTSAIILVTLMGCASKPPVAIAAPPAKLTIISPPKPQPVHMKPVDFVVVTKETQSKLDKQRVWYAISVESYENLAANTQDLLRYIRDQKAVNNYWEQLNK